MDKVVIIDAEKFAEYDNKFRQMADDIEFLRKKAQVSSKALYTNKDVMMLFDVTPNTLKNYRNTGQLGFSKVGDKYFYTPDDIALFLSKSHREAFY